MEVLRYVDEGGKPVAELALSEDELVQGYRALLRARRFDERALTLQRQGRLGVYPPYRGQEAAQVGMALALRDGDWMVPTYRETGAAITFGLPLVTTLLFWRAYPQGWRFPEELRILPFYIAIATQIPQAAGLAAAGRYHGEDWVVATFIGDGGTSEGDFHEGLNMASVMGAPMVLMVQNNGWAISVPTRRQMNVPYVALRAEGYGIPARVVDGNDLVAVWAVAREAVATARKARTPFLIEARTYRLGPHTTSDDPRRYRDEAEVREHEAAEPVRRLRSLLENLGLWDQAREDAYLQEVDAEIDAAVAEADSVTEPAPETIVEEVFAVMPPELRRAWNALREGRHA